MKPAAKKSKKSARDTAALASPSPPQAAPTVTVLSFPANSLEKYETAVVHRSALKNAPYNPRVLSDSARSRLRQKLTTTGLVGPPTWNRRTQNLVSGHQRVSLCDSILGTRDYQITVAVVDMPLTEEKSTNIFLNNPQTQGDYDYDKLSALFTGEDRVDYEDAGYTSSDIQQLFGTGPIIEDADKLAKVAEKIRNAQELLDLSLASKQSGSADLDDPNFYLVAVFCSAADRQSFTDAISIDDAFYCSGDELKRLLLARDPEALEAFHDANFSARALAYLMGLCRRQQPFTPETARQAIDEKFAALRQATLLAFEGEPIEPETDTAADTEADDDAPPPQNQ